MDRTIASSLFGGIFYYDTGWRFVLIGGATEREYKRKIFQLYTYVYRWVR